VEDGACAIRVERQLQSKQVLEILDELFLTYGVPDHIRSDNGLEITAASVRQWLARTGAKPLFIEPGSPWENGYACPHPLGKREGRTIHPPPAHSGGLQPAPSGLENHCNYMKLLMISGFRA
jgi:hypothetical protein